MKIFSLGKSLDYLFRVFMENPLLKKYNIELTDEIVEADIIIEPFLSCILKNIHLNKKFLLWTCEPFFDTNKKNVITVKNKNIHIINCYTGDIYMNNFFFFYTIEHNPFGKNFINKFVPKKILHRKIVAIMTYDTKTSRKLRTAIALEGHKKGIIDIYGTAWPKGISKGDSRATHRSGKEVITYCHTKPLILKNYDFCLAFENSIIPYYVTEKLWHAIANFTLPIYLGNKWIYETFPENSFIDYAKFKSNDELFDFIKNITIDEYNERLLKCINVVKNNIKYISHNISRAKSYEAFVNKLNQFKY